MIIENHKTSRELKKESWHADLVVAGGGMAGVCAAITAARAGIKVILVQDRPVLGGNSSSEVRLWVLGATSHMGNNNRWAREGGVIDEILVENTHRNKEGNPLIWDTVLLEKVVQEPNITLLLNTAVYEIKKEDGKEKISAISAFCSQNSTLYHLHARFFCDATGDGIVSFLAGASFRMGAETREEFGEKSAPNIEDYGELLGHSIFFYTKDTGKPVNYTAPSYALKNAEKLPKIRNYNLKDQGCKLWWVEYGGRMDTIHQSEEIKWELWKVIYGIWHYVKNSGHYPEAENYTLEWVGTIPGKRESRRFMGDYILKQQDIVEQKVHEDAVAFGGWAIDLHPADGVYSDQSSCTQWHSKGVYQIPYRCYYSKEIRNLFFAGRIISVSHVAFGSTRVMATCGHGAQAVGMAAALATRYDLQPRDLSKRPYIGLLQTELNKMGQSIPRVALKDDENLVNEAKIHASSRLALQDLAFNGSWISLNFSAAQLVPLKAGVSYNFQFKAKATAPTGLEVQLRTASCNHFTPDVILEKKSIALESGEQLIKLDFQGTLPKDHFAFITFIKNDAVALLSSEEVIPSTLAVYNKINAAVSNHGKQTPGKDIGIDEFEFWCPNRRPAAHNLAFRVSPTLEVFGEENLNQGFTRPSADGQANAWAPNREDEHPSITLQWPKPKAIRQVKLFFDTDFDHAMESVLMGHQEEVMPLCVRNYTILDGEGSLLFKKAGNYQAVNQIDLEKPVTTDRLHIKFEKTNGRLPVLYEILCYG